MRKITVCWENTLGVEHTCASAVCVEVAVCGGGTG